MGIKTNLIFLIIAIIFTVSPLIFAFLGLALARLFRCDFNAALVVCPGNDFLSNLLSVMIMSHWLGLFTLPIGGIVSVVLLIGLASQFIVK
ncbi:MAG: hypothetical protein QNJ68_14410 [Microcoleaceae cyanobacterium MO_207.B10]|nr:hypothetical protein [Microcoleaceae cyanobacterium MO_207.B10]